MNLTSTVSTSSSFVNHPIASINPLKASTVKTWREGKKKFKTRRSEFSKKAERRIPWRADGWSHGIFWIWKVTGKLVASRSSRNSGDSKDGSRKWPHNFRMYPAAVPHMEKVYSIVRQIYGRSPTDDLMTSTRTALHAVCFWTLHSRLQFILLETIMENLRFTKNQLLMSVKQLFQVTEKLIKDQTEISGLTKIDYKELSWRSTTLLCDKAFEITNVKKPADSVRCLGSMTQHRENEDQLLELQGRRLFSQEMTNKIETKFQCRHLQEGRRPWVHSFQWIFRRILWLDSKDSRHRNCNSINSLHILHSHVGRYDSKTKCLLVLIFLRKLCYGSKK